MSLSTDARQVLACVISVIYVCEAFRLRMAATHPAARVVARVQCTNSVVTPCRLLTSVAAASLCTCIIIFCHCIRLDCRRVSHSSPSFHMQSVRFSLDRVSWTAAMGSVRTATSLTARGSLGIRPL